MTYLSTGRKTMKIWHDLPDTERVLDAEWEGPVKTLWCIRAMPEELLASKKSLRLAQKMAGGPFNLCFLIPDKGSNRGWMLSNVVVEHGTVKEGVKSSYQDYIIFDENQLIEFDDGEKMNCPDCGFTLIKMPCWKCIVCGWSEGCD